MFYMHFQTLCKKFKNHVEALWGEVKYQYVHKMLCNFAIDQCQCQENLPKFVQGFYIGKHIFMLRYVKLFSNVKSNWLSYKRY